MEIVPVPLWTSTESVALPPARGSKWGGRDGGRLDDAAEPETARRQLTEAPLDFITIRLAR